MRVEFAMIARKTKFSRKFLFAFLYTHQIKWINNIQ